MAKHGRKPKKVARIKSRKKSRAALHERLGMHKALKRKVGRSKKRGGKRKSHRGKKR